MRLLIDENVPRSVVDFLRERGHEILTVTEHLLSGTPDPAVAAAGDQIGAVLVTWDKDFKKIASRIPQGQRRRFRNLSRLSFDCSESRGRALVEKWIEHIEFEYIQAQRLKDKRMFIVLQMSGMKIVR